MFSCHRIGSWTIYSTYNKPATAINHTLFFRSFSNPAWRHQSSPYRAGTLLSTDTTIADTARFTIFNPHYITRKFNELQRLYQACGTNQADHAYYKAPAHIVVFQPKRKAKQLTCVISATEIKIENDAHYLEVCSQLNNQVQPAIADAENVHQKALDEINQDVHEQVHAYLRHCDDTHVIAKQYAAIKSAILAKESKMPNDVAHQLALMLTTDHFQRMYIESTTYDLVVDVIAEQIRHQHHTPLEDVTNETRKQLLLMLPQYDADKRLMKVLAGGSATGKSTLTKLFIAQLKHEYNLSLSDFAYVATDRFRLPLLNDPSLGDDPILKSLFTHDEARLMTETALALITQKSAQLGFAPNVLMEAICPTDAEINLSIQSGCRMRVAITSYPPEAAVEGNYHRFIDKKERLSPVNAILGGQKLVSDRVPEIISNHGRKDLLMTIYNTDTLMHHKQKPALIAAIDCAQQRTFISDCEGMLDFVKKSHINVSASCKDTIYPAQDQLTTTNISELFLAGYAHHKLIFIDPHLSDLDLQTNEKYAYAIYSSAKGLVINNPILFREMLQKNEAAKSIFTLLDPMKCQILLDERADFSLPHRI